MIDLYFLRCSFADLGDRTDLHAITIALDTPILFSDRIDTEITGLVLEAQCFCTIAASFSASINTPLDPRFVALRRGESSHKSRE